MATSCDQNGTSFPPLSSQSRSDSPGFSHLKAGDFEQLLADLFQIALSDRGKRGDCVARICEEIKQATGGLLEISLFRPDGMRKVQTFYSEGPRYMIRINDRFYGLVIVDGESAHLTERIELSIKAQIIARICGLIFYYLETSTFFQDQYPLHEYPHTNFTKRERDVLRLMGQGNDDKMIAERLHIAPTTVRSHRERIYRQLEVHTIRNAIVAAFVTGAHFPFEPLSPHIRKTTENSQT